MNAPEPPEAGPRAFRQLMGRPGALRLFLLRNLPLAWLAGIKSQTLTAEEAAVTIRYRWINQNPFRSLYFAAQAMAAELSTGLLVMQHLWLRKPGVAMLVVGMQADFQKKATGRITFRCNDGAAIQAAIAAAVATGEGQQVETTSTGTDENGAVVATFVFRWSLKQRVANQ